jgi:hypothetical protein
MLEYFHAGHDVVGAVVSRIAKLGHGCERDCTRKAPAAILDLGSIRVRANRIGKKIRHLGQQGPVPASVIEKTFAFVRFEEFPRKPETTSMAPGNDRAAREDLL